MEGGGGGLVADWQHSEGQQRDGDVERVGGLGLGAGEGKLPTGSIVRGSSVMEMSKGVGEQGRGRGGADGGGGWLAAKRRKRPVSPIRIC